MREFKKPMREKRKRGTSDSRKNGEKLRKEHGILTSQSKRGVTMTVNGLIRNVRMVLLP
jgi:hypothetical protein